MFRADAANALANAAGAKSYSNYEEMLKGSPIDAAIVCTPPVTHPEICIPLLDKGVHVLCEKPLAIGSTEAASMLAAAARSGSLFTMASKFRFVDDVVKAKSIVESGFGRDHLARKYVYWLRRHDEEMELESVDQWWRCPYDNGTHSVDLLRFFLGPLAQVQVVEGKRTQKIDVEDTVSMFMRTEGDVMGSIDLSWSINKQLPRYVSIYGSQGTVIVGWQESKYRRSTDQSWIQFGSGYNKVQAFRGQIKNFASAIQGQETLVLKPEDAMASVLVIEAAYEAMAQNAWVPIKTKP